MRGSVSRLLRVLVRVGVVALAALLLAGCPDGGSGGEGASADSVTQRQRDSIVGESRLPGSKGVRDMMEASDRQKARVDRLDSLGGG